MRNLFGGRTAIRFRKKVMLGVLLIMATSVVSGANSVYNVRRVAESVNFSAVAASPLLIGVISLSESYQKLQGIFDPVTRNCAGLEGAAKYLQQSQQNQQIKLIGLKKLAQHANASSELARYEFSGAKIFKTRQSLLDACYNVTSLKTKVARAEDMLRAISTKISIDTTMDTLRLEDRLSRSWGRTIPTTSDVTGPMTYVRPMDEAMRREALRTLRDLYKLKITVSEVFNVSMRLSTIDRPFLLERMRKGYWTKLQGLEYNAGLLKGYFEKENRLADFQKLGELIRRAKDTSHLGKESIFNIKASLLEVDEAKQALVYRLQREQGQYSVALLNIMDVAQRINRVAQLTTEHRSFSANWEIGLGVLASTALILAIGLYFRQAVTRPLEALTLNVSSVAAESEGEADPIDRELLQRGDEIGDLAKQFTRTFGALAKARRELQEASHAELSLQRDRLHGAVENMPQGLYMLDADGRIIVANRRLSEIYRIHPDINLVGLRVGEVIALCRANGAGVKRVISEDAVTDAADDRTRQRVVELDDGRIMTMTILRLPDGGHVVTQEDITEKQAAAEKISHMALHDGLTNLANRTRFRSHIFSELDRLVDGEEAALLFLDLDRFKLVNDTLGHPIGDALLVQVAERLKDVLDEDCFAARLGGDEFAVFQKGISQPESAKRLADSVIHAISAPFVVDGHHIVIGTSIGIAIAPSDGLNADELSKNADLALYCAKQEGRGQFSFFEADMDRRMQDRRQMEHDLREAMVLKQFELYYQPIVKLENEDIIGFEALIRWHHPERGFVSPAEFIPVAEEAGLISELGAWILESACTMATNWPREITVAVNISPVQFGNGALPLTVLTALNKAGLAPERLMLEITEGVFLNDTEKTLAALNEIRALGVRFSMDDFGTGYSSLSYIRKFPFNKIKIDQSFVRGIDNNPESVAIIRAVTNLCLDLGMQTTAEGVETQAQAAILKALGCGLAQGYFFGRPMPAQETLPLFDETRRRIA